MDITPRSSENVAQQLLISAVRRELATWDIDLRQEIVYQQAKNQGVLSLIRETDKENSVCASWPDSLRHQFETYFRQAIASEMLLQDEIEHCLDVLHHAGACTLLTKGALLAHTLYNTPASRPRCDSDLFIPNHQKELVLDALQGLGYTRHNSVDGDLIMRQGILTREIGHGLVHSIDLHWHLFNRHTLNHCLPHDQCWNERVQIIALGDHAYGLRPAHALLHACLHRLAHHGDEDRLIWLYDILLLCGSFNAEERDRFWELCRSYGAASACSFALNDCERTFPSQHVTETRAPLASDPGPRDIAVEKIFSAGQRQDLIHDLSALASWRAKTNLLWQHAFPSRQYMRNRYDVNTNAALPWYYLKRLFCGSLKFSRTTTR